MARVWDVFPQGLIWGLSWGVLLSSQAVADVSLLNQYNQAYELNLRQAQLWQSSIQDQQQAVVTAKEEFDRLKAELARAQGQETRQQEILQAEKLHLEFLLALEPVSLQQTRVIQNQAVASGEFSQVSQVTPEQITLRQSALQTEKSGHEQAVRDHQNKIQQIEQGAAYQSLVSARDQARRLRDQKQSQISGLGQEIASQESRLEEARWQEAQAERDEDEARRQSSQIRGVEIPREETQRQRLQRRLDDLRRERPFLFSNYDQARSRVQTLRGDLQRLEAERAELQSQLQNLRQRRQELQSQLEASTSDEEKQQLQRQIERVQNRIEETRSQLDSKNQQIAGTESQLQSAEQSLRQAERELNRLDTEIVQTEESIRRTEREIRRLENLAIQWDQRRVDAQNRQIEWQREVRRVEDVLLDLRQRRQVAQSELPGLESQLVQRQRAVNDYRQQNIVPIENQIADLRTKIQLLVGRMDRLAGWQQNLLRQEANRQQAKEQVKPQQEKIQALAQVVTEMEQAVRDLKAQVVSQEGRLGLEEQKLANAIAQIEAQQTNFRELEKKVLSGQIPVQPEEGSVNEDQL